MRARGFLRSLRRGVCGFALTAGNVCRRRKPELAAELAALPDFRCSLRWEFCSPVFAPLLRRFAPHDTYELTKRGTCLRVDGTLKGLSEESTSGGIIPRWERGAFSLLFAAAEASDAPAQLLLADHDAAEAVDALPPSTARSSEDLAAEATTILASGPAKGKVKAVEFSFQPLRTWRGEPKRERVQGFDTTVYEAKGRVEGTHRVRTGNFALRVRPACAALASYLHHSPASLLRARLRITWPAPSRARARR